MSKIFWTLWTIRIPLQGVKSFVSFVVSYFGGVLANESLTEGKSNRLTQEDISWNIKKYCDTSLAFWEFSDYRDTDTGDENFDCSIEKSWSSRNLANVNLPLEFKLDVLEKNVFRERNISVLFAFLGKCGIGHKWRKVSTAIS